jgi:4-amino-4-deoxy-L-arabinose transferase-like glycosyltransferase
MSTNIKIALLVIISIGFCLRFYNVGENPVSMYWDEGAIAYDAYSLAQTGQDMHGQPWHQAIFLSYGDYKAPLYLWLAGISVKIFGPTVASVRLVNVIAGTLLILLVFLLGKKLMGKEVGLLAAIVLAVSPWGIQFSRAAFEANLAVLFLTAAVYVAILAKEKPWFNILSVCLGVLATYGYFSVRWVFPAIFLLVFILNKEWRKKTRIAWFMGAIILYILLLMPLLQSPLYAASNQFRLSTRSILNTTDHVTESSFNRDLQNNSWVSRLIYHRYLLWSKRAVANMLTHFDLRYLFLYGDSNLRHSTGNVGLFLLPCLPLLLIALFGHPKAQRTQIAFLVGWWVIALIPASIPLEVPHALRSLNALPAVSIIIGAGGWYGWQYIRTKPNRNLIVLVMGGWFILCGYLYLHDYWFHYPSRSATDWQYGYEQLARSIGRQGGNYQAVVIDDIDRFQNYLLFFNRIDPRSIRNSHINSWGGPISFLNYTIGAPISDALLKQKHTLLVIRAEHLTPLEQKYSPVEVINDYQGKPLYYVLSSDVTLP